MNYVIASNVFYVSTIFYLCFFVFVDTQCSSLVSLSFKKRYALNWPFEEEEKEPEEEIDFDSQVIL